MAVAVKARATSISYTYTEPTIFFEFALETAILAHAQGLKNIFVTNGYMSTAALAAIVLVLDAANIDLKSFRTEFYTSLCQARLQPVLETIAAIKSWYMGGNYHAVNPKRKR